jgi:hypothetical protein
MPTLNWECLSYTYMLISVVEDKIFAVPVYAVKYYTFSEIRMTLCEVSD